MWGPAPFGRQVKRYLADLEWKEADLSRAIPLDRGALNRYLRGTRPCPRHIVVAILDCLVTAGAVQTLPEANALLAARAVASRAKRRERIDFLLGLVKRTSARLPLFRSSALAGAYFLQLVTVVTNTSPTRHSRAGGNP